MLQRAFEWFWGLNLAQKVLAVLFAGLLLFSVSYLLSTTVLLLVGAGGERAETSSEQGAAPGVTYPEASQPTSSPGPDIGLKLSNARWEGEKAVVKGTWKGDISSVHCDLLEGGTSGKPTRWWDRSVGTQMDWSKRTFTQEFVAAKGSEGRELLDPKAKYAVVCSGQFSGGWAVSDSTAVEGSPPG